MIGNDIVDLALAQKESNWKRPRFLQKIFTKKERAFLDTTSNKGLAIWLLWSKKESAYKIVARMKKCRFFAPKKLEAITNYTDFSSPLSQHIGQVTFEQYTFLTKSVVTDTHIHTTAQLSDRQKPLVADCFLLNKSNYFSQHQITRQNLLKAYAERNSLPIVELSIQKDKWKVPYLYYKNQQQSVMVSIAHHGHYGGYVLQ